MDSGNGKLYWSDQSADQIHRCNLDGSGIENLLTIDGPLDVALDLQNAKLYWSQSSPSGIWRADLDGTNAENAVSAHAVEIALDGQAGKIYFTSGGSIRRANFDGSQFEHLFSGSNQIQDVALNLSEGRMYWVAEELRRADFDGADVELISPVSGFCPRLRIQCFPRMEVAPLPAEIEIECFLTPFERLHLIRADLDLPCELPPVSGEGSGAMSASGVEVNASGSAGGVPWLFAGGSSTTDLSACEASSQVLDPGAPVTVRQNEQWYLATFRYAMSVGATGSFEAVAENFTDPPILSDRTRVLDEQGAPVLLEALPTTVEIQTGSCCEGLECITSGVNQEVCVDTLGGNRLIPGATCDSSLPCGCFAPEHCYDANPCNGIPVCNFATGHCLPGPPPNCDDGDSLTYDFCDRLHPEADPITGCVHQPPLVLTLVPVGDSMVDGNELVAVEAFLTNAWLHSIETRGVQIDLPCSLPGQPGSSGTITTGNADSDPSSVVQVNSVSADGIPRVFLGGLNPTNQNICAAAQTAPLGGPPTSFIPAGGTRYMATFLYRVSECAAGDFDMYFECNTAGAPCDNVFTNGDQTRVVDPPGTGALPLIFGTLQLGIQSGVCCAGKVCLTDELSRECCLQAHPGAVFLPGRTCADPEPCICIDQCDCDPRACCRPDGTCVDWDESCCVDAGGVSLPLGTRCENTEACCLPDGTCADLDPQCCDTLGGVPRGQGTQCGPAQACCLPNLACSASDPVCCPLTGGTAVGPASECTVQACFLGFDECQMADPRCCILHDGTPGGSACPGFQACCLSDVSCILVLPAACVFSGGVPLGEGTTCSIPDLCCQAAGAFPSSSAGTTAAEALYWTSPSDFRIARANLAAAIPQTVVNTALAPWALAIDAEGGRMYWIEDDDIRRANLDGSSNMSLITDVFATGGIAIDFPLDYIYWASIDGIRRAHLTGSNVETIIPPPGGGGLVIDTVARILYWTQPGSQVILRAHLGGGPVETVLSTAPYIPESIALDYKGHIFWTEWVNAAGNPGRIRKSNLDGSGIEELLETPMPFGLAVDREADTLYWANPEGIHRARLDGTEGQVFLDVGYSHSLALLQVVELLDCQPNGSSDSCDLVLGTSQDCDGNDIPDECDIAEGRLDDEDANGVPDVCEVCGDGDCDPNETSCNCEGDCGAPQTAEIGGPACSDGADNDCDGLLDCEDPDCALEIACDAIPTVNQWGLVILTLLLVSAQKISFRAHPNPKAGTVGM